MLLKDILTKGYNVFDFIEHDEDEILGRLQTLMKQFGLRLGCSLDKSLISSILQQCYLQYRLLLPYFDICYQLNI